MTVIAIISRLTRKSSVGLLKDRQISILSHRFLSETLNKKSTDGQQSDEQYDETIQNKILNASLSFVPMYGWSQDAIAKGAESIGYPGITHGIFPKGGGDLVSYFYKDCNAKLAQQLKQEVETKKNIVPKQFITWAIEQRLRLIIPYKSKWPQALAIMALPPNVTTSLSNLLTTVDDILYYSGDRSVNFKWYTRRLAIGGLYKSTELIFIEDNSPDYKRTWDFLAGRADEIFELQEILKKVEPAAEVATQTLNSGFITVKNMLGVNWNR